jgi:uncharacterized protein YigA (DUF484 family)
MNSEDVASYLKEHPEFFEQYAPMIAEINIPHPHGGRTIPISERQILSLREKGKQLESKLREVIQYGEENDVVGNRMHALTLDLMRARSARGVVRVALEHLHAGFAVPHVALRVWRGNESDGAEFQPASEAMRAFAVSLVEPKCGPAPAAEAAGLFGEGEGEGETKLGSYAYIPLRDGDTIGLLALASEEQQRYHSAMGTLYLTRLGELIACALAAHLPPA